jgi:NAD-dependent SIR2 family protein deacetylase
MGYKATENITKGKCNRCQVVWYWKTGKRRLKDTRCKVCGGYLRPTTHLMKRFAWKQY